MASDTEEKEENLNPEPKATAMEIEIPEATKEESKKILAINKETVHRICSGQVVLNLAVAVKELVENSIDAGATIVEVKLKEQGLECVEVTDNGSGVEERNIEGMTAKYHTSKIREFADLTEVETFGFRGEALSSLCALADMKIVTKHKTAEYGLAIELDHEGKIKNKSICPREVGTTVTLSNLFSTLPVRKREFQKNIKREFTKMCQILQAYCLISKGVKIICSNITDKGRKTTFLSTQGSESIKDNIVAVFGSKQASELIQMKLPILNGEKFNEESFSELEDVINSSLQINNEDIEKLNNIDFQIDGWISSCNHGSGRSSKDRQYFFINSRPCDSKNLSKLVNDMYHRYNVNQFPFVFLNLVLQRSDVDVNVTPDKRQLLLYNEKILLLAIKKSLTNTFGNVPSTFKSQNSTLMDFKVVSSSSNGSSVLDSDIPSTQNFMQKLSQWKLVGNTEGVAKPILGKRKIDNTIEQSTKKMKKIQEFLTQQSILPDIRQAFKPSKVDEESDDESASNISDLDISVNLIKLTQESKEFESLLKPQNECSTDLSSKDIQLVSVIDCKNVEKKCPEEKLLIDNYEEIEDEISDSEKSSRFKEKETICVENEISSQVSSITSQDSVMVTNELVTIELDDNEEDEISFRQPPANIIETSIEEIKKLALAEDELQHSKTSKPNLSRLKFKSEIDPNKNKKAEEELDKEISKDMFAKMEIIGQFNLGFIIVKLNDDLFIVDQHATDEKYNFEDLQKTVVLQNQPLTVPERLQLTAVDEMILIDNLKVFEANGFKIAIDHNAEPTKKLKLLGKPFSRNWQFGKEDIADLLFMLHDAPPDTMVRPSKVRSMFASRACRKSIMIGTPLNKATMRRLINHMGEIEQPWNCPHGRPTMRHLINLAMIETETSEEPDES